MKKVQLTLAVTAFAAAQLLGYAGTAQAQEPALKKGTNLLFPFVSNQSGFDTALSVANTSADPFGTKRESGSCIANFYGANAPGALPTPPVPAGQTYATLLSAVAPGFSGYIILTCDFSFAHGFAILGGPAPASYLALVVEAPRPKTDENLNN
jgi:hypothetical protein